MADAVARKVIFATSSWDAKAFVELPVELNAHGGDAERIASESIGMSPTFINVVSEHRSQAQITFDKFHVIAQAGMAMGDHAAQAVQPGAFAIESMVQ